MSHMLVNNRYLIFILYRLKINPYHLTQLTLADFTSLELVPI
jgi:hypothetical protein